MIVRPRAMQRRAIGAGAALLLALAAGCSSVPLEPAPPPSAPAPAAPAGESPADAAGPTSGVPGAPVRPQARSRSRGPAPAARGSRCGGCYLDDGPGDNPPPDLAGIPDAVPRAEPLHPSANRPYSVFGVGYVPRPGLASHRERGVASWYGRKFHGRQTSSGERYDMYGMTAAHPTLPIPSYVRVTSVRTGRSVVVRVNDRGPFLNRRVIDLTYTAAWKLGYVDSGSAEVDVELLTAPGGPARPLQTAVRSDVADGGAAAARTGSASVPMLAEAAAERLSIETTIDDRPVPSGGTVVRDAPSRTESQGIAMAPASSASSASSVSSASSPTSVPSVRYAADSDAPGAAQDDTAAGAPGLWLQVGAFGSRDNAEQARARLQRAVPWLPVPVELLRQGEMWRVQVGPWARREDALAAAERIAAGSAFRPIPVVR